MESVTLTCVDHWFKNLLRDLTFTGSFCDVTLVLDDHSQMKSHRVVLAASSYFFKNILLNNEDQENQIIYLSGIQCEELEVILEFIYFGESTSIKDIKEIKHLLNQYQIPYSREKDPIEREYY